MIDDTVMVVGSMGDPSLCGQLELLQDCRTGFLDGWSLCSPSAKGILMY